MQTIPVNVKHLKAVSLFAGKQDIRYYLNGVMVEVTAKAVRLVAADGHTLGLTHTPHDDDNPQRVGLQCIIPIDIVKAAIKGAGKSEFLILTVPDDAKQPHSIGNESSKQYFEPLSGKFPDYRRVIPTEITGEPANYNPEYLLRAQKAADVYTSGRRYTTIEYNGSGAGLMHGIDANFIGVVMPWKGDSSKGLPEWFAESPEAPK